jgi:hypothetical protein
MDITKKIDDILSESAVRWFTAGGTNVGYRRIDKKNQVEVLWKSGKKTVKVQFRNMDSREYIGHVMVPTQGMKAKEFLKYVDKEMKNIWKAKKK